MRIVNRTGRDISYELKGGPLRMTLSKCDLAPDEEEVWTSPYKRHQVDVACELTVILDGTPIVASFGEDAVVVVTADGAAPVLTEG